MKYSDIQNKSTEEIAKLTEETQDKVRAIRFEIVTKNYRQNTEYGKTKKLVAQLKTELRARKK